MRDRTNNTSKRIVRAVALVVFATTAAACSGSGDKETDPEGIDPGGSTASFDWDVDNWDRASWQ